MKMSKKVWYEIYGVNKNYPNEEKTLLVDCSSQQFIKKSVFSMDFQ